MNVIGIAVRFLIQYIGRIYPGLPWLILYATGQKNTLSEAEGYLLAHEDSNLDNLNQNQMYCHYTMGQSLPFEFLQMDCKSKGSLKMFQMNLPINRIFFKET